LTISPSRPRLHIILAEAALELVPEPLWDHPSVSKAAKLRGKRPGETLLDDTYHHAAMNQAARKGRFVDQDRRGRPDIVHTSLLVALESRLNKEGRLRVWVHTRDDRLLSFRPDVRIQRAQHRFYGLMERLLIDGVVPQGAKDENVLIACEEDVPLKEAIDRIGADRVVVFDEGGTDTSVEAALLDGIPMDGSVVAVIGAYPTGAYQSDLSGLEIERVALGTEPLTAWTVTAEAVVRSRQ
jgi:rRNA small subunit pseudouridine methyltransferase Nep1